MPVVERSSPRSFATVIWSMLGWRLEHQHDAELPVGDAERAGFLQKQRHGNLVRAADHEARPAVQRIERMFFAHVFPYVLLVKMQTAPTFPSAPPQSNPSAYCQARLSTVFS